MHLSSFRTDTSVLAVVGYLVLHSCHYTCPVRLITHGTQGTQLSELDRHSDSLQSRRPMLYIPALGLFALVLCSISFRVVYFPSRKSIPRRQHRSSIWSLRGVT